MEKVEDRLAVKVQALSDLELAVLICLVADQHCIIESDLNLLNDIEEELKLVREIFTVRYGAELTSTDRTGCIRPNMCGPPLHRRHHARRLWQRHPRRRRRGRLLQ
jgi:hypothetical protein